MIHRCSHLQKFSNISHGFFEKSAPEVPSLNCAFSGVEVEDQVIAQRQWMMKSMTGNDTPLLTLKQIHSPIVHIVESATQVLSNGDGLVTRQKNVALGVLTADCGPVIFVDPQHEVIGVAHAGWRGAFAGILENTIETMESLGADRKFMSATLGPTIQQSHYEVGPEFEELLGSESTCFLRKSEKEKHFHFDLPLYIMVKLKKLGVHSLSNMGLNTFTNNFFSRRRALHNDQQALFQGRCNLSAVAMS